MPVVHPDPRPLGIAAISVVHPIWEVGNEWFGASMPRKFARHTGIERRGVSTEADVRAALGAPTGVSVVNGQRLLVYSGASYAMRPQSFIPIVGAFAGGADWRASHVLVTIGSDGRVADVQSHHQEQGATTGLAATPPAPVANQPR